MSGHPVPLDRDALPSILQQILEEQMASLPSDLTADTIVATFQASMQMFLSHIRMYAEAEAEARTRVRLLSQRSSDPVASPEVDHTPPFTNLDIPQNTIVSTETTTRAAAGKSYTNVAAAVACSSRPGPSAYHYRPTGQRIPGQDHTHRRLGISNASTATVKIEAQPPQLPFDAGTGDGTSSDADDSSSHVGGSTRSIHTRRSGFVDDETVELHTGESYGADNISHRDDLEDGDHIDDAAADTRQTDSIHRADATDDDISEESAARTCSSFPPTRVIHDSGAADGRAMERVRVSAARPQHPQPAQHPQPERPAPSSPSSSRNLSQMLKEAKTKQRTSNGGNRSDRSHAGTNHVYKVLKPSRDPMRKKPLLVNGSLAQHN
jgi:hypothetical protein